MMNNIHQLKLDDLQGYSLENKMEILIDNQRRLVKQVEDLGIELRVNIRVIRELLERGIN